MDLGLGVDATSSSWTGNAYKSEVTYASETSAAAADVYSALEDWRSSMINGRNCKSVALHIYVERSESGEREKT